MFYNLGSQFIFSFSKEFSKNILSFDFPMKTEKETSTMKLKKFTFLSWFLKKL